MTRKNNAHLQAKEKNAPCQGRKQSDNIQQQDMVAFWLFYNQLPQVYNQLPQGEQKIIPM